MIGFVTWPPFIIVYRYEKRWPSDKANLCHSRKTNKLSLSSDPYGLTVEENWSNFKEAVIKVMDTHIPSKIMRLYKDIPWLNHNIKSEMRERKKLYQEYIIYSYRLKLHKTPMTGICTGKPETMIAVY